MGTLPKADFAASLLFKLEKTKLALAQRCYGAEAEAAGHCGRLTLKTNLLTSLGVEG